jgi:shikimate dehydrogenase
MHNAAYRALGIDAVYELMPVSPDEAAIDAALARVRADLMGVNVTVPHKQAVMPRLDVIEARARRVGAVNTIVVENARLVGYNTDVYGFHKGLDRHYRRAVVLGAGGSARAVLEALDDMASERTVIARRPGELGSIAWNAENLARALDGADLLVDTTSAGLADDPYPTVVPLDRLAPDALVYSLIYHREPALLRDARARGLRTQDGLTMLVHQAALAFQYLTGVEAPIDVMRAAAENANASR